jgi:hypothetical protein
LAIRKAGRSLTEEAIQKHSLEYQARKKAR